MHQLLRPTQRFLLNCFFIGALAIVSVARGATYFVDFAAGSDANAGTSTATAWKRCPGDPMAAGKAAATSLQPGDTVQFKGGVTYALNGGTGIILRWSGSGTAPITYDGNSAGTWGTGRARFTDWAGSKGIAAFSAASDLSNLDFKHLEFISLGGASMLPADNGQPAAARFGAGIMFYGAATNTRISNCVFQRIGYAFNQKPMAAASISGIAIGLAKPSGVTISGCDFSRVGTAIELGTATSVSNLSINDCKFHDFVAWTINMPEPGTPASVSVSGCTEVSNAQFNPGTWTGYGASPRTATQSVLVGAKVTFSATVAATPSANFQWHKNGTPIVGANGATLTVAAATAADAGTYTAVATNAAGSTVSNEAVLTVSATPIAPVITRAPVSAMVSPLSTATFTVTASGTPAPAFQWYRNGVALSGRTSSVLMLSPVSVTDAGEYTVVASNAAGSATSAAATLTVRLAASEPSPDDQSGFEPPVTDPSATLPPQPADEPAVTPAPDSTPEPEPALASQLANMSVRATAGRGDATMIVGFVVRGSATKSLLVRGIGPTLGQYGVPAALPDPVLSLFSGSQSVGMNDGWSKGADGVKIAAAAKAAGAFALPENSHDTALLPQLAKGAYTAQITGAANATALLELYDLAPDVDASLANVSVRAAIGGAFDNPIIGFVVTGTASKKLLIRAVGPTLRSFGVENALADPQLEVFRGSTTLGGNNDWAGAPTLIDATRSVGAFALTDGNSKDAAFVFEAAPGAYTALVSGVQGSSGVVLFEVYVLD